MVANSGDIDASGPARPRRKWIVVTTIVVVIGGMGAFAVAWYGPDLSCGDRCVVVDTCAPGPDVQFVYRGGTSGYLTEFRGPTPAICDSAGFPVHSGSSMDFDFAIFSSDLNASHSLLGLTVQSPFQETALTPKLPVTIAANGTVYFDLTVVVPGNPGTYSPVVVVTAQ